MNRFKIILMLLFFMVGTGLVGAQEMSGGYHVLKTTFLPGNGGWDYLTMDSADRRLYVGHNNSVQVLDADTLKLIGTVEDVPKTHGIVILPDLGKGFVSSGPGSVVVFDLKTLKRVGDIRTSKDTDNLIYDSTYGKLWAFAGDSQNATVIDPVSEKVIHVLKLGGTPEAAVSDGHGDIFDNLDNKNEIVKINAKTMRITRRWSVAPGKSNSGLAMDLKTDRLFLGCRNEKLIVMDAMNGKVMESLPIGPHVDGTCFDASTDNIFTTNGGNGTITVIHEDSPDQYHVVENVKTELGARTITLDSQTGNIYTDTAKMEMSSSHQKYKKKMVPGSFQVLEVGK